MYSNLHVADSILCLCGGFINRVVAGQEIMVREKIKGQGRVGMNFVLLASTL